MANRISTPAKSKLANRICSLMSTRARSASFAAALILASADASALGLGALEIDSNLDQPLDGKISLRAAAGDDLNTVKATIASRDEFESLGIDYPSYLENIDISLDQSTGQPSLKVTSSDVVIKEPFIHFLVRVEWSGGSFLREYTALIDPPVYAAETPQSIAQPREVGTDQSYQQEVDAPAPAADISSEESVSSVEETVDEVVAEDVEPVIEDNYYATDYTPDTQETEVSETESEFSSDVAEAQQGNDAVYGPVASGESLSLIAAELQRQFPDLSIYQIMQILFEENQSAFIDGNINGLIQGSVLKIADLEAIRSVDVEGARAFYRQQISDWNPSSLISSSDSLTVGDDSYNFDTSLEDSSDTIADTSTDSFQVGSSSETNDFVSADQGGNRDGEVLALRGEISNLQTSLASSELENQELKERISILEGQLADVNRLMELGVESADLANVESTLAEQNDAADVASTETADDILDDFFSDTTSADEVDTSTEELADTAEDDPLAEFLSDSEEAVDDSLTAVDDLLGDDTIGSELDEDLTDEPAIDSTISAIDDQSSAVQAADETEVEEAAVATSGTTDSQQPMSFMDKVKDTLGGGLLPILGGVGALLLAGLGLLFVRRKRADEEFEVSMLSIESNSESIDQTQASMTEAASLSTTHSANVQSIAEQPDKETSFLTVYSDSDAVVQADEVDPVAEADVYIAYGRTEQAEEVLLDGIASHPDRIDIKHKLLSLYHTNQNAEGFERVAEEMYSNREGLTPELWQEISQMGKAVAPDNPLFALSGDDLEMAVEANSELSLPGEVSTEATSDDVVDEDDGNEEQAPAADVETVSLAQAMDAVAAESQLDDNSDLVEEALSDADSIQLIDFDDGRSEISELDEVEINALDNADADDPIEVVSEPIEDQDIQVEPAAEDEDVLEISIDDDDGEALEFTSIDVDADDEDDPDASERAISEVQEVSDLEIDPEYDEARTQYELAKVFVDLGDDDGARTILNELVANDDNDDEVISDAKQLLESIS